MNYGTLYGVGVGSGNPDLITLKAMKILGQVDVIFAAASTKNSYSLWPGRPIGSHIPMRSGG